MKKKYNIINGIRIFILTIIFLILSMVANYATEESINLEIKNQEEIIEEEINKNRTEYIMSTDEATRFIMITKTLEARTLAQIVGARAIQERMFYNNAGIVDINGAELITLPITAADGETNHDHVYELKYDEDYHWEECFICHKVINKHEHSVNIDIPNTMSDFTQFYLNNIQSEYGAIENIWKYLNTDKIQNVDEQSIYLFAYHLFDEYWNSHSGLCGSGNQSIKFSCDCGYSHNFGKMHNYILATLNDRFRHPYICNDCGEWQIDWNLHDENKCHDAEGNILGCSTGIYGTCVECGFTYFPGQHGLVKYYREDNCAKCQICNEKMFDVDLEYGLTENGENKIECRIYNIIPYFKLELGTLSSNMETIDEKGTMKWIQEWGNLESGPTFEYPIGKNDKGEIIKQWCNSGGTTASSLINGPNYENTYFYDSNKNEYYFTSIAKYPNDADPKCISFFIRAAYGYDDPNDGIDPVYATIEIHSIDGNNGLHSGISSPDNYAPIPNDNFKVDYEDYAYGYAKKATLHASFNENYDSILEMAVFNKETGEMISNWETVTKGENGTFTHDFNITGIETTSMDVIVKAKDRCENVGEKEITIVNLDNKSPTIKVQTDYNDVWAKEKVIKFIFSDTGVGNVQIAFNKKSDYQIANKEGNIYTRTYIFNGYQEDGNDFPVFVKDALGNEMMYKINIGKVGEKDIEFGLTGSIHPDANNINRTDKNGNSYTLPIDYTHVDLNWTKPNNSAGWKYSVYQRLSGESQWKKVGARYCKPIKVLNVHYGVQNGVDTSNIIRDWMNEYGNGLIDVTPCFVDDFNVNANTILKDSNGYYIYDVIFIGTYDEAGKKDISEISANAIRAFANNGGGVLFGHDSLTPGNRWYSSLKDLVNIEYMNEYGTGGDDVYVSKKGTITIYPHDIESRVLEIPYSHSNRQVANGDIWFKYNPSGGFAYTNPNYLGGRINFYLTTWNNAGMIQTGHSSNKFDGILATSDEKMVIANTLFYLAQRTTDTYAHIYTAMDETAPSEPDLSIRVSSNNNVTINADAIDNGTTYEHKVEAENEINGQKANCTPKYVTDTVMTGIEGYYIIVNNEKTVTITDSMVDQAYYDGKVRNNFNEGINSEYIYYIQGDSIATNFQKDSNNKYIHIAAMDKARNIGPTTSEEIKDTTEVVPTPGGEMSGPTLNINKISDTTAKLTWNEPYYLPNVSLSDWNWKYEIYEVYSTGTILNEELKFPKNPTYKDITTTEYNVPLNKGEGYYYYYVKAIGTSSKVRKGEGQRNSNIVSTDVGIGDNVHLECINITEHTYNENKQTISLKWTPQSTDKYGVRNGWTYTIYRQKDSGEFEIADLSSGGKAQNLTSLEAEVKAPKDGTKKYNHYVEGNINPTIINTQIGEHTPCQSEIVKNILTYITEPERQLKKMSLTASYNESTGEVKLNWTEPYYERIGDFPGCKYKIHYRINGSGDTVLQDEAGNDIVLDTHEYVTDKFEYDALTDNGSKETTFEFWVECIKSGYDIPPSNMASIKIPAKLNEIFLTVQYTEGNNHANLAWTEPYYDKIGDASGNWQYTIYAIEGASKTKLEYTDIVGATDNITQYKVEDLKISPDTKYRFVVIGSCSGPERKIGSDSGVLQKDINKNIQSNSVDIETTRITNVNKEYINLNVDSYWETDKNGNIVLSWNNPYETFEDGRKEYSSGLIYEIYRGTVNSDGDKIYETSPIGVQAQTSLSEKNKYKDVIEKQKDKNNIYIYYVKATTNDIPKSNEVYKKIPMRSNGEYNGVTLTVSDTYLTESKSYVEFKWNNPYYKFENGDREYITNLKYEIYRKDNVTNEEKKIGTIQENDEYPQEPNTFSDTLDRGTSDKTYTYYVKVINNDDIKDSNEVTVSVPKRNTENDVLNGINLKVSDFWVEGTKGNIKIEWNNPYYQNGSNKSYIENLTYTVQRKDGEDGTWKNIKTGIKVTEIEKYAQNNIFVDSTIPMNTNADITYYYRIVTNNRDIPDSNEVEQLVQTVGKKLIGIQLELTEYRKEGEKGKVKLEWSNPYQILENGNIKNIDNWEYKIRRIKTGENTWTTIAENLTQKAVNSFTDDDILLDYKEDTEYIYQVIGTNNYVADNLTPQYSNKVNNILIAPFNNLHGIILNAQQIENTENVYLTWNDPYTEDNNGNPVYELAKWNRYDIYYALKQNSDSDLVWKVKENVKFTKENEHSNSFTLTDVRSYE